MLSLDKLVRRYKQKTLRLAFDGQEKAKLALFELLQQLRLEYTENIEVIFGLTLKPGKGK